MRLKTPLRASEKQKRDAGAHLASARCWDWPPCGRLVRVLGLGTAGGGHVRFRVLTHYREKIVCQNFPQFIGEYGKVVDF